MLQFVAVMQADWRPSFPGNRSLRPAAFLACVVICCVLQPFCLQAVATEAAGRPNIVLIMADDLGYGDLGCYGQELLQTPNIDRLAHEGTRFSQAYAGGSVCTASRSVLMTGLHNGHTPARDNIPHYKTYLQDDDVTVAEVLHDAGYRTGGVGKWSLGDARTIGRATQQGFDRWFGYLNQDHAHYYFPEYLDDDESRRELSGNTQSRRWYSHHLMTDEALKFIETTATDQPFFLYVAWTLPHFSAGSEDPDRLAVPSTDPYTDRNWDDASKKYAAMVHLIDQDVGRIMELIESRGQTDNTLILFTSDNGGNSIVPAQFKTGGPLRGFKRDLTEGGIRVPFIARWPGHVPADSTSHEVIAFQDILPTFAELAGAPAPNRTDGLSLVSLLNGGELQTRRDYLYFDYGHCRSRYDQAVRWNNWKGIRLGIDSPVELYDLGHDIGESTNVAEDHPDVVKRIIEIMDSAATPDERYTIGRLYTGKKLWSPGGTP